MDAAVAAVAAAVTAVVAAAAGAVVPVPPARRMVLGRRAQEWHPGGDASTTPQRTGPAPPGSWKLAPRARR